MFDCNRLFKILFWLSREVDLHGLAQDSYVICTSILKQLASVDVVTEEFLVKLQLLEKDGLFDCVEAVQYRDVIARLNTLKENRACYESKFRDLKNKAEQFWLPATADMDLCSPIQAERARLWREKKNGAAELPLGTEALIVEFQNMCVRVMHEHFQQMLEQAQTVTEAEIAAPNIACGYLSFTDVAPAVVLGQMEPVVVSVLTDFPVTHFFLPSKSFAKVLGYIQSRLITVPFLEFIVNAAETNFVVDTARQGRQLPSTIIFYRRSDCEIVCVRWELCEAYGYFVGVGIDITSELMTMRSNQGANIQRVLRQWLHSIRNASFQQQAELIEEDVRILDKKLTAGKSVAEDIERIYSGLRTLIYTAKTSVGIIDQALYSTGLTSLSCVADFANALTNFPANFSETEGYSPVKSSFELFLNRMPAGPSDLKNIYVGSDLSGLQIMIDNIYSNAIRYTAPEKGVRAELRVVECGASVQFFLIVEDFAEGGLPAGVVQYLQDSLGFQKLHDLRTERARVAGSSPLSSPKPIAVPPRPPTKSSKTGIPHIVEVYHDLTRSGEHDLDILITVRDTGTSFSMQFVFPLVAPPPSLFEEEDAAQASNKCMKNFFLIHENKEKKFLVVDDSPVIRRLLTRFFTKLDVPFVCADDGSLALQWFQRNQDTCCGLITDLEMPRMGGAALIQAVKQDSPDLPCVIISGNEMVIGDAPAGVLRVLTKPVSVDALQNVLEEMLGLS